MEFRFSTHQPSESSIWLRSVDWCLAERSFVLPALIARQLLCVTTAQQSHEASLLSYFVNMHPPPSLTPNP